MKAIKFFAAAALVEVCREACASLFPVVIWFEVDILLC